MNRTLSLQKNMLSIGMNKKMSKKKGEKKGIASFNIPAGKYCFHSTELCQKYCYTKKSERMFKTVRVLRENNFMETLHSKFSDHMMNEIDRRDVRYLRIHESGDFYNNDYFSKWLDVIKYMDDCKFLTFTKNFTLPFKEYSNLNLFLSIFPDSNYETIELTAKAYSIPCAYTILDNSEITDIEKRTNRKYFICAGKCFDCFFCFDKNNQTDEITNVIFYLH